VKPLDDEDKASICAAVSALALAVTIGGASTMKSYDVLHATELDSHANMAVAGYDCTVIA
jgi:hypothetical protein